MTQQDINKLVSEAREKANAATEGPWLHEGPDRVDYECEECGNEFPEGGYAIRSQDQYKVLECHLYEMESLCKPNIEFITHARTAVPALCDAIELLMKQLELCKKQRDNLWGSVPAEYTKDRADEMWNKELDKIGEAILGAR